MFNLTRRQTSQLATYLATSAFTPGHHTNPLYDRVTCVLQAENREISAEFSDVDFKAVQQRGFGSFRMDYLDLLEWVQNPVGFSFCLMAEPYFFQERNKMAELGAQRIFLGGRCYYVFYSLSYSFYRYFE